MRYLKQFNEYMEEGVVKKIKKDSERAKSLISESERKTKSLKENINKIGIKEENANDYVEYCYDTIMLLIRAKMYLDGYNSSGQGAHESEIAYTRFLGITEKEILFLDQLRYFRNGILYYGKRLDKEYAEKVIEFSNRIYPKLKNKVI